MDENTLFKLDETEGTFWVEILSAVEEDVWEDDRRVRKTFPVLRVTTYADAQITAENRRYIALRGRKYSIDEVHVWRGYEPPHDWGSDHRTHYAKYFETEAGTPLDWRSPVRDKLRAIEYRVRDRFVAEHPEWQRTSLRRRVVWQIEQATNEAAMHRRKAEAADAVAAKLLAGLEAM
ncbi:hypothetical protein [Actinoplanes sp. NPDC049265]|uniref:hypothetical protein n=1 Tax=Actinoplanes sp. NPDC049265 TaxID=3363902 RepID=UPI00371F1F6A